MNKLSRLTALLLALLMLLSSTGLAEAASAIPFGGLNYSTYERIFESASQAKNNYAWGVIAEGNANYFDNPSLNGMIGSIPSGTLVKAYGVANSMRQIEYNGEMVYVSAQRINVCACTDASMTDPADHQGTCVYPTYFMTLASAKTAQELHDAWSGFTAGEQAYLLAFLKANAAEKYAQLNALLNPTVEKEESKTTEDGTKVTVSGSMPENVELKVASASVDAIESYIPGAKDMPMRKLVLDIALVDDLDIVWQPDEPVTVTVNAADLGEEGDTIVLFHVHNGEAKYIGDSVMDAQSNITFTMDGFSYIFAVNACDEEGCILEDLAGMTPDERYTYLTEELNPGHRNIFLKHYQKMHAITGLICNCSTLRAPGVEGHDRTCAWHPEEYFKPVVGGADGTSVTVSGNVPAGVTMNVKGLTAAEAAQVLPGIENLTVPYIAMDITLNYGGEEWQPNDGEKIGVTLSAQKLGENANNAVIYHIHDGVIDNLGLYAIENGNLSFDIDGFSCIMVISGGSEEDCWVDELKALATAEARYAFLMAKKAEDEGVYRTYLWHYIKTHYNEGIDTDLQCICNKDVIGGDIKEPWIDGHAANCPWHASQKPQVVVNGVPTGSTTTVTAINPADIDLFEALADIENKKMALGVSIKDSNGAQWQPDNGNTVSVTMYVNSIGTTGDPVRVYYVAEENGEEALKSVDAGTISSDGTVTFSVSSCTALLAVNMKVDLGEILNDEEITPELPAGQPPLYHGKDYDYIIVEGGNVSSGAVAVELPKSGKTTFTVDQSGGQWQILAGDVWANITGETGSSLDVTYAMFAAMGTSAQLRWVSADGTYESHVATVTAVEDYDANAKMAMFAAMPLADGEEGGDSTVTTPEKCFVEVKYQFGNGSKAADSWTAEVAVGSSLKTKVYFPEIVGYEATWQGVSAIYAELDLTVNGSTSFIVTYVPTDVVYKVEYYQEKLNYAEGENKYELVRTVEDAGKTGSIVSNTQEIDAVTYNGFTRLRYKLPEIAADGSTVVEVYFNRNYYLMNFDLRGGTGVEPIYDRFGAEISIGTPERAGYTFAGWSQIAPVEGQTPTFVTVEPTMPAGDKIYYANWTPAASKYTVFYMFENADSADPNVAANYSEVYKVVVDAGVMTEDVINSDDMAEIPNSVTLTESAEHFERYRNAEEASNGALKSTYTVAGDGTTNVYVYYKRNLYTIRFYYAATENGSVRFITSSTFTSSDTLNESLTNEMWRDQEQTEVPQVNANLLGTSNGVTGSTGTQTVEFRTGRGTSWDPHVYHTYTLYYYDVTARYNADISAYWPNELIDYTKDSDGDNTTYHDDMIQNSWIMRLNTPQYLSTSGTKTYKGVYFRLDDNIIYSNSDDDYLGVINGKTVVNYYSAFWRVLKYEYTYNLYVEPTGDEGTDAVWRNGYVLYDSTKATSGSDFTGQNNPNLVGFTYIANSKEKQDGFLNNSNDPKDKYSAVVAFYYTRNKYVLNYMSNGTEVKKESAVPFEKKMTGYAYTPTNGPENTVFAGWYTTETFIDGTEYDFATETMPANNVTLYAKWIPVNHEVTFYLDKNALDANTPLDGYPAVVVPHGSYLADVAEGTAYENGVPEPENKGLEFVEWFYIDENGKEKAFVFESMQVLRDMKVYGKWRTDIQKEYVIYYMLDGTSTQIAAQTVDFDFVGQPLTYDAKGGTDLYSGYQTSYFPVTQSHTFVLQAATPTVDDLADTTKYTKLSSGGYKDNANQDIEWYVIGGEVIQGYTFFYTHAENVPYIVRYVDEAGNMLLEEKVVANNSNAIVTETSERIPGYMPDAYQKRLALTGKTTDNWLNFEDENGNIVYVHPDNVITFVYSVDTQHAYYTITHYTQNLDDSYSEYQSSTLQGDIDTFYTGTPLTINGFTYVRIEYKVNGVVVPQDQITNEGVKLTADGLEINLYYDRNAYPYYVQYLEAGTNKVLYELENIAPYGKVVENNLYGATVSETAISIPNYTVVGQATQAMTIKIDDNTGTPENVFTFYYAEKVVTINYRVVGLEGCGTVSPTGETVYVLSTNTATGSTATANTYYTFDGWYTDAACTTKVDASWVDTNNKITPQKAEDAAWVDGTTYYAKFIENKVTLNYKIVGPDGTVDDDGTAVYGSIDRTTEQVAIVSGTAQGSLADPNDPTYKFVGWYTDQACTNRVSTDLKYVPTKADGTVWANGTTYYAKFDYNIADLTITKTITGYDANCADDVFTFEVTLDPGTYTYTYASGKTGGTITTTEQNPTATITITGQDTVTIEDIVITSEYTVEETNLPTGYSIATAKVEGTIAAENNNAAFANVYSTGKLTISKTVAGTYAPQGQYAVSFEFTVTLPNGTYTVEDHTTITTLTVEKQTATVSLKGGESVTITGIPAGASYTVAETANDNYTTEPSLTQSGTIEKNDTQTAAFTNTYKDYPLTINKTVVDSNFVAGDADRTFTFEIALPETATDAQRAQFGTSPKTVTVTVDAADKTGSASIQLPAGSYVVTEKDHGAYTVKMKLGTNETETDTVNATVYKSQDSGVTVTNTRIVRDVTVNKVWDDENNFHNLRGAVNVTLTGYTQQTLTADDNWTYTWTDVPVYDLDGNEIAYTVTEAPMKHYETTYAVNDGAASATAPTLDLTASDATVYITNKLPFGELTIKKTGLETGEHAQFTVTGPNGESFTVVLGGDARTSVTLTNLNPGSYTVSETEWSWTYKAEKTSQTAEVEAAKNTNVIFTNTKSDKWLYDEGGVLNTFEIVPASQSN